MNEHELQMSVLSLQIEVQNLKNLATGGGVSNLVSEIYRLEAELEKIRQIANTNTTNITNINTTINEIQNNITYLKNLTNTLQTNLNSLTTKVNGLSGAVPTYSKKMHLLDALKEQDSKGCITMTDNFFVNVISYNATFIVYKNLSGNNPSNLSGSDITAKFKSGFKDCLCAFSGYGSTGFWVAKNDKLVLCSWALVKYTAANFTDVTSAMTGFIFYKIP